MCVHVHPWERVQICSEDAQDEERQEGSREAAAAAAAEGSEGDESDDIEAEASQEGCSSDEGEADGGGPDGWAEEGGDGGWAGGFDTEGEEQPGAGGMDAEQLPPRPAAGGGRMDWFGPVLPLEDASPAHADEGQVGSRYVLEFGLQDCVGCAAGFCWPSASAAHCRRQCSQDMVQ